MRADTTSTLPSSLVAALNGVVTDWEDGVRLARLWAGDARLWTGADEGAWLGWLRVTTDHLQMPDRLARVSPARLADDFDDALLLGMGGSSLCPDVLRESFDQVPGAPRLQVLDSTDPDQVRSCEERLTLDRTLVIVSSKSGTTLETHLLFQYFFSRIQASVAPGRAGERFVAITDPGSELEELATERRFRAVFHGASSIGGRYSALSNFGMVPASVIGIDIGTLLRRADDMRGQCDEHVPVRVNPGAMLGLTLGAAAQAGCDKLTFVASPTVARFGDWVEQLVAESTGKEGRGVILVTGETLSEPDRYGRDRIFVYLRDEQGIDPRHDTALDRLAEAGHPVLRISMRDRYDLGAEFFRWEFATSVLGAVLRINPFDQPGVEASKLEARKLTQAFEIAGALPTEAPLAADQSSGIAVYADAANEEAVGRRGSSSVAGIVAAHCDRLSEGDYFAVLAYIEMSEAYMMQLQELRHSVRDATGHATCIGFGPRYLHSTGQMHKGGPNTGVFLQITCEDAADIAVPEHAYTFGVVKAAQARGDLTVLGLRGRKAIRLHIAGDVGEGLRSITEMVKHGVEGRS